MSPLRGATHHFVRLLSLCHTNIQVSIRMRPSRDGNRSPATSTASSSSLPGLPSLVHAWAHTSICFAGDPSLALQIQGHQRGHRREVVELWWKLDAARASP